MKAAAGPRAEGARFRSFLFVRVSETDIARSTRLLAEINAISQRQNDFLGAMSTTVETYLNQNARRWVDMKSLFSFMKI